MNDHKKYMKEAIKLASQNANHNHGGPFGAIVVKDGEIVGQGVNKVTTTNDPTAHAEVVAIRDAAKNLDTFNLEGCEIYSSCEPCPMCLGAIYWARPDKGYYACTREDDKLPDVPLLYDEYVQWGFIKENEKDGKQGPQAHHNMKSIIGCGNGWDGLFGPVKMTISHVINVFVENSKGFFGSRFIFLGFSIFICSQGGQGFFAFNDI